jgi:hypothetical protein
MLCANPEVSEPDCAPLTHAAVPDEKVAVNDVDATDESTPTPLKRYSCPACSVNVEVDTVKF